MELTETWLEEKGEKILCTHLKEYNYRTIAATKANRKGRARGGPLLAARKGIAVEKFSSNAQTENQEIF